MGRKRETQDFRARKLDMRKKFAFVIIGLILIVLTTYSLIGMKNSNNVNLKLKYFHQAQFAGNYVAQEKGFYKEKGLNVNIEPFSSNSKSIDAVGNGTADFGIAAAKEVIEARARGVPIKAVAVVYKISPIGAYSLKESNITEPHDFVGKKVGLEDASDIKLSYVFLLNKLNINRSQITEVPVGWDAQEVLDGTVDVSTGYINNEPYQLIKNGKEVNIILMSNYGIDTYADVIIVRDDTIKNNPELVEKFLRATLKGWTYSFENQKEAVDITLKYSKSIGREKGQEKYMLVNSIPLINTEQTPLGWMTEENWQAIKDKLVDLKEVNESVKLDDVYTNEFLKKIYNE